MAGTFDAKLQLSKKLQAMIDNKFESQLVLDAWAEAAKGSVVSATRAEAPHKTGELANSIYAVTYHSGGNVQIMIKSRVEHAKYVLGGTKRHDIPAGKTSSMLNFWWEREQVQFVGPIVDHPGMKANNFPAKVWPKIKTEQTELFKRVFMKALIG